MNHRILFKKHFLDTVRAVRGYEMVLLLQYYDRVCASLVMRVFRSLTPAQTFSYPFLILSPRSRYAYTPTG